MSKKQICNQSSFFIEYCYWTFLWHCYGTVMVLLWYYSCYLMALTARLWSRGATNSRMCVSPMDTA